MNDEVRKCSHCNHEHRWGILRYSQDNTPLYGARPCWCHCDHFVHQEEGNENLPAMTQDQVKELWAATPHLNAQVPVATRIAVANIQSIGKNQSPLQSILKQWPEFMGLMISQVTDVRSAIIRDETKFAHLVSHTDEIVEAMRGVVQLKERLDNIYGIQERQLELLEQLASKVAVLEGHEAERKDVCVTCGHPVATHHLDSGFPGENCELCPCKSLQRKVGIREAAHAFTSKSAPLWNEPIAIESEPTDD